MGAVVWQLAPQLRTDADEMVHTARGQRGWSAVDDEAICLHAVIVRQSIFTPIVGTESDIRDSAGSLTPPQHNPRYLHDWCMTVQAPYAIVKCR